MTFKVIPANGTNKFTCYKHFIFNQKDSPCILRTFIHPSKSDSPYKPFHSPFLKGESPFERLIHQSRRVIHPSKKDEWKGE